MGEKQYYIYLLTNKTNSVLYCGVTNDIKRRVYEHKKKLVDGFTNKYNVDKLVYYEICGNSIEAIKREKQIKGWRRDKKDKLISGFNPEWKDLYDDIV